VKERHETATLRSHAARGAGGAVESRHAPLLVCALSDRSLPFTLSLPRQSLGHLPSVRHDACRRLSSPFILISSCPSIQNSSCSVSSAGPGPLSPGSTPWAPSHARDPQQRVQHGGTVPRWTTMGVETQPQALHAGALRAWLASGRLHLLAAQGPPWRQLKHHAC